MKAQKSKVKSQSFKREFSAGGCVFRRLDEGIEWLVGKHSGYHKWVLPKGMIEPGETGMHTAVREVWEETGVEARVMIEKPVHELTYWFWAELQEESEIRSQDSGGRRPERRVQRYQEQGGKKQRVLKKVAFFLMEYVSGEIADHSWEMEDVMWLPYDEALARLHFESEREALRQAQDKLLANRV